MADKKLNNVSTLTSSTLTSSDYAYVEDVSASNEQKKVTISDLAKVVGGQYTSITSSDNANNLVNSGMYVWGSGSSIPSNVPSNINGGGKLVVIRASNFCTQIIYPGYYDSNNRGKIFKREAWVVNENITWSDWYSYTGTSA